MPEAHRAQPYFCHQRIEGFNDAGQKIMPRCGLTAYAWCYNCDLYLCDIHRNSRHFAHTTVIEFPDNNIHWDQPLVPTRLPEE